MDDDCIIDSPSGPGRPHRFDQSDDFDSMNGEQYGVVVHGRWSDDEKPQATVIRSIDGWVWCDMCTTDPETADEIAEALAHVAACKNGSADATDVEARREQ